jgi:hypothetical protein
MFSASGANFGCHLQCFLPLEQILAAICNVFCLWSKCWVLFAMFSASGANFGCYLQCFLPLEQILVAICNVSD